MRFPVQFGEYADFRAQEFRNDGHGNIIHGAALVSLELVEIGQVHRGDKDDRGLLTARMLVDHLRQLKPVELRHAHIHEHDGDIVS